MKNIFLISIAVFICHQSYSQGCVAIRSTGGVNNMERFELKADSSKWLLTVNNRYFKSFRHFVGTAEQKQRIAQGTEVINHAYTADISLTRLINKRWSFNIDLPVIANTRSSLYEHDRKNRYKTHSFGVGDMRFTAYYLVMDPDKKPKGNVQVGLGIKLPTGDYKYQDYFHITDSTTRLGPVDQSIQLGDGGTGFTTEINGYYNFSSQLSAYGNFYYLINPREQNGVSTARGGTPSTTAVKNGSDVMSVPDQYMIRAGLNLVLDKFIVSAGVRDECLPVRDLIGGSNGFRRPGYIISVEPGITWQMKKIALYAYLPVAVTRSRTQSVPDKITTQLTGKYTQGDAAFADYTINTGMSVKF